MKKAGLFIALAAGTMLAGPVAAHDDSASKGQAELAELLEGRVAGEPQSCVWMRLNTPMRIIDHTAIVVDRGRTIYVNVPSHPDALDDGDVMQIRRLTSELCRTDIITTFDRTGGFYSGNIFLGDFVPYTKVES